MQVKKQRYIFKEVTEKGASPILPENHPECYKTAVTAKSRTVAEKAAAEFAVTDVPPALHRRRRCYDYAVHEFGPLAMADAHWPRTVEVVRPSLAGTTAVDR